MSESKFCVLLRNVREKKGLTKKQVAEIFGWTAMYYGRYENGQLNPTKNNAHFFSSFLGISEDDVLKMSKDMSK